MFPPTALLESYSVSRREALRRATGTLAGMALAPLGSTLQAFGQSEAPAITPSPAVIDAHSHVWTDDVARYPLAAGFSPADMRPVSFTPQQLLAHARPCGVGRVVLIQMSYYGTDNSYMLAAMREFAGVFSGVAVVDEHDTQLPATVRELKRQGVHGFRIHPAKQPVERWLSSPGMAALWKLGADENLAMCALVNPDALVPLDAMCRKFPETPLVIDHFARIGVAGTLDNRDIDKLCRLARHPRTYVKVSAFYALGKKQAPYTDLAPMIRQLLTAFGHERLMWATDCPYQVEEGHTYRDSIELIRSRLDFLSAEDRSWLLGKTAQRVFFS